MNTTANENLKNFDIDILYDVDTAGMPEKFIVADNGIASDIIVDESSDKLAQIVSVHLAEDIYNISGARPRVKTTIYKPTSHMIIIGQLSNSPIIAKLIARDLIDISSIRNKRESYLITTIPSPLKGVEAATVIVGSDRRGMAYGVYELSEMIGVSPWHWFADVRPTQKNSIRLEPLSILHGPPSVKYRGIFINDESWGLVEWASKTFAPEEAEAGSGLGPKTYSKICELLLRMKANYLCPGMHIATRPFNFYEQNKHVADDYGIIVGTSHCEPMLRNNEGEWKIHGSGPWKYDVNRDAIYKYWEDRVKTNAAFENVYTVGIRGVHDSPMEGPQNTDERIKLLEQVIRDQRKILADNVNPDVSKVPQAIYLYKEVLELYHKNIELPDDITVVWPDDNHGYIRALPAAKDRQRSGGHGIYYHISYYGTPQGYLWLSSTPLAQIALEMTKAHISGADELWVVNVGNFKAHEIATEFFLKMAWDIKKWNIDTVNNYYAYWAKREFGSSFKEKIANIAMEHFRLNHISKPEHVNLGLFSDTDYGDEAQYRLNEYKKLEIEASRIYDALPEEKKDAFYQLLLYPIRCSLYMNEKFIYAQKNHLYAKLNCESAKIFAEKALAACSKIDKETDYYNSKLNNGKWRFCITSTPHGLTHWTKNYAMPKLEYPDASKSGSLEILTEGSMPSLPVFSGYTRQKHFFDICNKTDKPYTFSIETERHILPDKDRGTVEDRARIWIDIDWDNAPKGSSSSGINVITSEGVKELPIKLFNPQYPSRDELAGYFIENNGCISIDACNYAKAFNAGLLKNVKGIGRSKNVVLYLPETQQLDESINPWLEYDLYTFSAGKVEISVYTLPTHSLEHHHPLQYAVSIDDHEPAIIDFEVKENSSIWSQNVLRGASITSSSHTVNQAGKHKLKIKFIDSGVALDKIVINTGGLKDSHLGPRETRIKKDK